ncbi:MAG: GrpB family protein, partial [Alphaproteobacteria bacterium]|nr:GrpB family protein [Alphaproteobacteria bacterium]
RALGYKWFGEYGLAGRRYCYLKDEATGQRLFQLHCYQEGSPEVPRHLAFRDYLRAHPALALEYEAEKVRAAKVVSDDVNAYNNEKNDWIKRVEKDALVWLRSAPRES